MKNENFINYKRDRKDMTLIIGARCKDGVVLIADKRIIEGTDATTGEKITILPLGIIVAGAGTGEIIDKFNERIPYVLDERKKLNYEALKKENPEAKIDDAPFYFRPYEFLEDCEGLLFQLNEKYKRPIQVLVATGNSLIAELNYIDTEGFLTSKRRTYMAIGSGSPYANFILKKLWRNNLSMLDMAKIGKFIINYIAEVGVDTYVGGGIQIVFVPNLPHNFNELNEKDKVKYIPHENNLEEFDDKELRKKFNEFFENIDKKIIKD